MSLALDAGQRLQDIPTLGIAAKKALAIRAGHSLLYKAPDSSDARLPVELGKRIGGG